jgi:hypothetical protein
MPNANGARITDFEADTEGYGGNADILVGLLTGQKCLGCPITEMFPLTPTLPQLISE